MADKVVDFRAYLDEEINKVKGVYYPVRASFFRRKFCKKASCHALHPNPEDEFCFPDIGPNYGIISKYQEQYRRGAQFKTGFEESGIDEPLMVQKVKPDGYMILNGHHRWAAALRSGKGRGRGAGQGRTERQPGERLRRKRAGSVRRAPERRGQGED